MFECTLLSEGTAREEDINYESAITNCDSSYLQPQPEKPDPEEPEKVRIVIKQRTTSEPALSPLNETWHSPVLLHARVTNTGTT